MSESTRPPLSSGNTSSTSLHRTTIKRQDVIRVSARILIIAIGYMLVSMLAGPLLGRSLELGASGINLLCGILVGATLAPIATGMKVSRFSQWFAWGCVLFLNALSLGIEGSFFAPTLSPMRSMPVAWTAYLLLQSLATAGLIAWLFGEATSSAIPHPPHSRAWYSWTWRFLVSSFSYLLFYFIFGAINYALVTRPYYAAHVSGLAVPPPQTVLLAEAVRAPLIVLSIVPLLLLWTGKRPVLAAVCGIVLFVIGGVIPLLTNTALPDFLRFASAIEIFFQNFLTGVVAAPLLGFAQSGSLGKEPAQGNSLSY